MIGCRASLARLYKEVMSEEQRATCKSGGKFIPCRLERPRNRNGPGIFQEQQWQQSQCPWSRIENREKSEPYIIRLLVTYLIFFLICLGKEFNTIWLQWETIGVCLFVFYQNTYTVWFYILRKYLDLCVRGKNGCKRAVMELLWNIREVVMEA